METDSQAGISNEDALLLFAHTNVDPVDVFEAIGQGTLVSLFRSQNITVDACLALRMSMLGIQKLGATNTNDFLNIGLTALHLREERIAFQMLQLFGQESVVSTFINTPSDAVDVAGSCGARCLCLGVNQLLEMCSGFPHHALAVLHSCGKPVEVCEHLDLQILLDTGLRAKSLNSNGYSAVILTSLAGMDATTAKQFGFSNLLKI